MINRAGTISFTIQGVRTLMFKIYKSDVLQLIYKCRIATTA